MNLYPQNEIQNFHSHSFYFLKIEENKHLLSITLNRPEKKNALHPQMVNELAFSMQYAHLTSSVYAVLIQAEGDVFCAGADLKAMMGQIDEHSSSIPKPKSEVLIGELFNKIHKPVIAKVCGNVYAGGFFFLAGAHYVVCLEEVSFALPEIKRGIFPFQVMAALLNIMPARKVLDWCMRGYNMNADEALKYGLITHIANKSNINSICDQLAAEIIENSPSAIRLGLEAYDHISPSSSQHEYLHDMLQKTIKTKDAQEGLIAFKEKRKPNWSDE